MSRQLSLTCMETPSKPQCNQSGEGEYRISKFLFHRSAECSPDTADTPPVYQCPEGHLICKDCNAKMAECPQCGHSLLNARNRTAEVQSSVLHRPSLNSAGAGGQAEPVEGRHGEDGAGQPGPQCQCGKLYCAVVLTVVQVSVGSPQRIGRGLFSYISYRWVAPHIWHNIPLI